MSVTSLFGWSTVGEAPDDHISNESQIASRFWPGRMRRHLAARWEENVSETALTAENPRDLS